MPAGRNRHTWTPEQARLASQKATAARRLRAQQRAASQNHPNTPAAGKSPAEAAQDAIHRQLDLVRAQIADTCTLLQPVCRPHDRCPTCKRAYGIAAGDRAQLLKALAVMLEQERQLLGIPRPGTLRPSSKRQVSRGFADPFASAAATEATQPAPADPAAPGPDAAAA